MKSFTVYIKEKKKFINKLSFLNLNNEIVNVMYGKTIANSTRRDLIFFILIFFLFPEKNGKSALYFLFEKNISKLEKLNEEFSKIKGKLKKGQYRETVEKLELQDLFEFDVLFLLIRGVLEINYFEIKFSKFFSQNPKILLELKNINDVFGQRLLKFYREFSNNKIEDDRWDEKGEYHDLSKSVYRTVKMRMSRRLDVSIQQFTEIKEIKSQSPIDLTFIQDVDQQIIFDLWDKYHLGEYVVKLFGEIKNHVSLNVNLGDLINTWIVWRIASWRENRKAKAAKKEIFEVAKKNAEKDKSLLSLNEAMIASVIRTPENLRNDIKKLKKKLVELQNKKILKDKEKLLQRSLFQEIQKLENIVVEIKENNSDK